MLGLVGLVSVYSGMGIKNGKVSGGPEGNAPGGGQGAKPPEADTEAF